MIQHIVRQLIAFALMEPDFEDQRPIATQWIDANGNFCYAVFGRWNGERELNIFHSVCRWDNDCLFSGSEIPLV